MSVEKESVAASVLHPGREGGRNYGLDFIRASAIALVIVAHYATAAPVCGVLGVEVFFVLSGYLIGGILYRMIQSQDPLDFRDVIQFWVRRWMRTLPNYYFFLLVFVVIAVATGQQVDWSSLWRYPFFLQNLTEPPAVFYGISWSLAVEEWFYLFFPAAILCRVRPRWAGRPGSKRTVFLCCAVFTGMRVFRFAAVDGKRRRDGRWECG